MSKKKQEEYMQKLNQAMAILNRVAEDNTTPRNIRRTAKQASDILLDESLSLAARAANAIDLLDEISQDPNMPMYTSTRLWNVISVLEGIRDQSPPFMNETLGGFHPKAGYIAPVTFLARILASIWRQRTGGAQERYGSSGIAMVASRYLWMPLGQGVPWFVALVPAQILRLSFKSKVQSSV